MSFRSPIQRRPLGTYFLLTFVWSWGWWTLYYILMPGGMPGGIADISPGFLGIFCIGGIAPSLVGITLTRVVEGSGGLRRLFARLAPRSIGWYALALVTAPVLLVVSDALARLVGARMESPPYAGALVMGIGMGLSAGLMEEFGWRGFALPRLQARHGAFVGTLILGSIWSVWHAYPGYWFNAQWGWWYLPNFLVSMVELTAYTVLITWVYNNTQQNMLACILMHIVFTGGQIILLPGMLTPAASILLHAIFAALLWLVVAVIVVRQERDRWCGQPTYHRQSQQIEIVEG